jgi:CBS domain-containing protein
MTLVNTVMKTNLVTAASSETVSAVARRMKESHLGAVLLVDNKKLTGIFTERDLLNRVISEDKNPQTTLVSDVATSNPIVVNENSRIKECAQILRDKGFRHLPVVDDNGKHIGIVSSRDFFQYMAEELELVIDKARDSGGKIEEDFDIYEYLGAGGCGLPHLS